MTEQPQDAAAATARLEAAIQRHAGWQLEYEFGIVIRDRKRLLARIAGLEAERDDLHAAVNLAETELTERIVARILQIADAQKDPSPGVQAFRRGLLIAAGEANIERLFEPPEPDVASNTAPIIEGN